MLKKEEVYVVIEKKKNYEKFNKIVNMFNVDYTLDFHDVGGIAVFDDSFLPDTQTKTKVSLKELRNILARGYLKEGDVVVCGNLDCRFVLVLNGFEGNYIYSNLWYEINSKNVVNSSFGGNFNNFIRYATEEEKQLLKPKESVIDKAISLLQHGLGLDYSHEVVQGLEALKNK